MVQISKPLIGFKFHAFPQANLGYNLIMDNLEKIHEQHKATMLVDTNRILPGNEAGISGPHYGAFFMADLLAERYVGMTPPKPTKEKPKIVKKNIRVFRNQDLTATEITHH